MAIRFGSVAAGVILALLVVTMVALPGAQAAPTSGSVMDTKASQANIQPRDPNPNSLRDSIARHMNLGRYLYTETEPSRRWKGGTSVQRFYRHGVCHYVIRRGVIEHRPHYRPYGSSSY